GVPRTERGSPGRGRGRDLGGANAEDVELVALRVGERPPLDAVQDPILPVPRPAERLDPDRGVSQVGGTEVQVDPDLPLLRFGNALDAERRKVGTTLQDQEATLVEFLLP